MSASSELNREQLNDRLQLARELSVQAGEILLHYFRKHPAQLDVEYKGSRDLVTVADQRAEECIVAGIRQRYPTEALLSEEVGHVEGGERDPGDPKQELLWIVDPLDGTTNFTHGHPMFAVSIACWQGSQPLVGVIHAPYLRESYEASLAGGAFCNGEPISVSEENDLAHALLATGFSYQRSELEQGALHCFRDLLLNSREVRRGGSACLDLAHTARGVFSGFWEWHLKPHDVGAGCLLVQEAGGRVTDIRGGNDYLHGRSLIAGSPVIHEELIQRLAAGPPHPGRLAE